MCQNGVPNHNKILMAFTLFLAACFSISPIIPFIFHTTGNIIYLFACAFYLILVLRICIGLWMAALAFTAFSAGAMIYLLSNYILIPINIILLTSSILIFCIWVLYRNFFQILYKNGLIMLHEIIKYISGFKISLFVLIFILCVTFFAFVNSLYWGIFTARVLIYFLVAVILIGFTSRDVTIKFIEIASRLHYWVLLLAIIGFLYAFYGGEPLFSIPNEDGRINGFYLTTFSNTYLLGFIRPSGFYDEPGALSFYVCFLVALREIFHLDRKLSWKLMLFGFITSSLAHFIFFILFCVHSGVFRFKALIKFAPVVLVVVGLLYYIDSPFAILLDNFFSRFEIIEGSITGDNRSALLVNAYSYLDRSSIFFGLNPSCILNAPECMPGMYAKYGENPLTLMVHLGLTLAWVYYIALTYLLLKSRHDIRYIVFGVIILILQRPNILSYGYTILIVMFIYSLWRHGGRRFFVSGSNPL
jgi:hypothetical protein